jgi:hypothetical protein
MHDTNIKLKTIEVNGAKTIMIKTSGNDKPLYIVVLECCDGTMLSPYQS